MQRRLSGAFALVLCCSCEALAQPSSADRILQSFSRCRTVAEAERLQCFEQATSALESEVKGKKVTIVDRAEVTKARKSLFGFTVPKIALFGNDDADNAKGKEPPEFNELNSTVVTARSASNGRFELRLADDDAVWMTTDPMPFPPRAGSRIRIRKGTLGNYFMTIDGERSVRGMRVR